MEEDGIEHEKRSLSWGCTGDTLGIYWGYTVHLEPKKTSLFGFLLRLFVVLRYAYHKPKKLLSSVCRVGGSSPEKVHGDRWMDNHGHRVFTSMSWAKEVLPRSFMNGNVL